MIPTTAASAISVAVIVEAMASCACSAAAAASHVSDPCGLPKRPGPGGLSVGAAMFSAARITAILAAAQNNDMAAVVAGGSWFSAGRSWSSSEDCATAQLEHRNRKNIFVMVIIMLVCHLMCECMSSLVKSCQNSRMSQSSQWSQLASLNFHRK